jgi:zinc transport system substrate-binding protein
MVLARRALALAVLVTLASSCRSTGGERPGADVVAGFARLAEVASRVGGERVRVRDLTPPGAEPHDVELSSDDVDAVLDADVVLYLGGPFQPGLAKAATRARRAVDLLPPGEREDPHVWLDPPRFAEAVGRVEEALAATDPAGAPSYRTRASALRDELDQLHADYQAGLAQCQRRVIVTSHDAFARLARRYGLEQEPLTGISPSAEPDPARLAELADLVRRRGVTHVFTERLVSPRVAEALAREAGVRTLVLDPLEGEVEGGYVAGMRRNLDVLRTALGCA